MRKISFITSQGAEVNGFLIELEEASMLLNTILAILYLLILVVRHSMFNINFGYIQFPCPLGSDRFLMAFVGLNDLILMLDTLFELL